MTSELNRTGLVDMVLEVAVAGECNAIVTYNQRDFAPAADFGIGVRTTPEFLFDIGVMP